MTTNNTTPQPGTKNYDTSSFSESAKDVFYSTLEFIYVYGSELNISNEEMLQVMDGLIYTCNDIKNYIKNN